MRSDQLKEIKEVKVSDNCLKEIIAGIRSHHLFRGEEKVLPGEELILREWHEKMEFYGHRWARVFVKSSLKGGGRKTGLHKHFILIGFDLLESNFML